MNSPVHVDSNETDNHTNSPPIDENILNGPPSTTWKDFKHAKLRQFPGDGTQIKWLEYLGHGAEGIVYKATIEDGDPVAIKVFWRTMRPKPQPLPRGNGFRAVEWPFEDESRTVALIEKIKWVMSNTETNPDQFVKIRKGPKTFRDAIRNLYSFSDEGRQSLKTSTRQDLTDPPPFPPLPICYGWMRIQRDRVPRLDPPVRHEVDDSLDWHWALVYEFVPGAKQDLVIGQLHLDFFYAIGFALEAYKPDNWQAGTLQEYASVKLTSGFGH
ncbi:hypothetical protein O1611_g7455 [Lasiodiplodia mahajangana]|uniref:Uncharacterized protein n=1 Tax=Lasiodiplodia mahajangana TaxID=1108764 RepID=A0ACC2JF89_9PEZI|nr:hypothetical protein O1611_g7455 [Lasiodiplodia mahajangana]